MEYFFRTILYVVLAEWGFAGCQIILDIKPKIIRPGSSRPVTIRCHLDMVLSRTDTVYSIMLKKGGSSVAILFQDGSIEMTESKFTANGSVATESFSTAFLQLSLDDVTCMDKGEYSCSMAVRHVYNSMELGPVTSRLEVKGDPSGISLTVTPDRPAYTEGEVVNITCSVLKNYEEADWSWFLPNQNNHNVSNNCTYDESECLHMCSSSIEYTVTRKDAGGPIKCLNGELKNEIKLNLSHSPNLKDLVSLQHIHPNVSTSFPDSSKEQTTNVTVTNKSIVSSAITHPDSGGIGLMVLYVLVSAFAVILVFTLLHLFLSDRKCKCQHSTSNNCSESHHTESHRIKRAGSKVIIIHARNMPSVPPHKDIGDHEAAYLHPEDPTDCSMLQNQGLHTEPIYEEIE
ncbi:uncharacterized protein [Haliotis cracherodii]|uniref:uncharacterized protein n=1 Tax=Haliotis cracherodii TaxID=6455 RepID=UPI0039E7F9CD